ncbi:unnamed protein product [Paramecium pentaurelia]|uniref:Uncharacterized protein n=1 Tax=Paramecium pentaurelia TaxID=43138 RepID=A0A8S1TGU2_9CILI|nr:unnamed protein product [Paramecium pentaurelia]
MGCGSIKSVQETNQPIQMKQKSLKLKTSSTLPEEIKKKVFRNKDGKLFYIVEEDNKYIQVPLLNSAEQNSLLNRRRQMRTQSDQLF